MPRERPILFSAPMVRAILDGRKTQTRRIVKPQFENTDEPPWEYSDEAMAGIWTTEPRLHEDSPSMHVEGDKENRWRRCPYGVAGDRLWVRETFYCDHYLYPDIPEKDRTDSSWREQMLYFRSTDGDDCIPEGEAPVPWKPSIYMPRWASRITLEITKVRVERLHDISEADAKAEGIEQADNPHSPAVDPYAPRWRNYLTGSTLVIGDAVKSYSTLWDKINGKGAWDKNPWVWCIEFQKI